MIHRFVVPAGARRKCDLYDAVHLVARLTKIFVRGLDCACISGKPAAAF
jgi:hypothetical protein